MDLATYAVLNKKIDAIGNIPDEKITEAVNTYLDENPPTTGATAEQAAQINKNVADIDGLKGDLEVLNEFIIYENLNWEQGVIDGKGIIKPNCTTRIYTPVYYPLKYFINRRINIDSDYEYAISCCDEDGNTKDNLFGYLDINQKKLSQFVVWYKTSTYLYDYNDIIGDYYYIRLIVRKKDVPIEDTSNPITPNYGSMLTIDYSKELNIVNRINPNNKLWAQWNNRLAFGMNTANARVPVEIDGQLYANGTIIAHNTGVNSNNRWGFHVFEAYAKDNYSRMTMLLNKHDAEMEDKPSLEFYYYTGANHHEKSYGYTKVGSDVKYHSFYFSRDKLIAAGVIDCRYPLTLANISLTNDIDETYETVEEADNAFEPEDDAQKNVKCLKYIYYKNAINGSLYYDKDTNHVMAKIGGEWQELSYHAVGDIVMSSLSLNDFKKAHFGNEWKLIKTESFNDPTGENQTINYYKRIN